ncbi:hypothetical protein D3C73_896100 [compost metagenome]
MAVPDAERKRPFDVRQRSLHAPLDDGLQQQARIGAAARQIAQLRLQHRPVVDAAIQAQHVAPTAGTERLQRHVGRRAAMTKGQSCVGIGPVTDATAAALLQRPQHRRQLLQQLLVVGRRQPGPDHAAHRWPPWQWQSRERTGQEADGMRAARGWGELPCSAPPSATSVVALSATVTAGTPCVTFCNVAIATLQPSRCPA